MLWGMIPLLLEEKGGTYPPEIECDCPARGLWMTDYGEVAEWPKAPVC